MGGYSQRRRFNNEFDVFGAYHELDFNLNDYVFSQGSSCSKTFCVCWNQVYTLSALTL